MSQQRQRASTKAGTPPLLSSSPIKRQRLGISLEQKQAIIDNLQLELTDRARRLRAQYNQQAQTLRSRIQMRVNRVPRAMLKMTMADLVARAVEQQKRLEGASVPPPVPEKDFPPRASPYKLAPPARSAKRLSDAMLQRVGTCACYRHRASHENTTGQHHYGSQSAIATWDANRQTSERL
ncbi:Meiotically up-regulated gene 118 protein [Colletotrichum higginsianum]|uniref:Meiotically up-regulated gene 118 protein n=1 Tax=Colletotrichum higginsianum TaxID=80884 RepID=A0A4T0VM91_9PEZI|nr:Meiotically up-regulated gene 118 protein [Colletotrichum higginsianum]